MASRYSSALLLVPVTAFALLTLHMAPVGAKVRPTPSTKDAPAPHAASPSSHAGRTAVSVQAKGVSASNAEAWSLLNSQLVSNNFYKNDVPQPSWLLGGWYSKCDLWDGKYGPCLHAARRSPTSPRSSLVMEPTVQVDMAGARQAHQDPNSFVAYNRQAYETIKNQNLDLSSERTWKAASSASIRARLESTLFSKDALVMKAEVRWFRVPEACSSTTHSPDCNQNIWAVEPDTVPAQRDVIAQNVKNAQNQVAQGQVVIDLNLHGSQPCTATSAYAVQARPDLGSLQRHAQAQSQPQSLVPLSCFYFVVFHDFSLTTGEKPETSNQLFAKGKYGPHDVIVLVMGFHLIRGGDPDWSWGTYWWSPDTSADPAHCTHPPTGLASKLPWNHYCADMASSAEPLQNGLAAAHYNPYIEQFTDGGQSNCLHCHSRAMYRDTSRGALPGYTQNDFRQGKDRATIPLVPCSAKASANSFCNGGVPTHFLWSLANHFDEGNPTNTSQHTQ